VDIIAHAPGEKLFTIGSEHPANGTILALRSEQSRTEGETSRVMKTRRTSYRNNSEKSIEHLRLDWMQCCIPWDSIDQEDFADRTLSQQ